MSELLVIDDIKFDTDAADELTFLVEYSSKRKLDKKPAQGDDDDVTDKGRESCDITIKLSWPTDWPDPSDEAAKARWAKTLKRLEPRDPESGGAALTYAHARDGLDLSSIKAIHFVKIEEAKGPNCAAGSRVNTLEIKGASWTKPKPKPGKTEKGKKFVLASETGKVYGKDKLTVKGPAPAKPGVPKP